jgi:hypothetical protein
MRKEILTLLFCLVTLITYSQEYKFGKISKEALEEKVYAKDSVADAVYLYKSRRTYYSYNTSTGFNVITEVKKRVKIYNKKGFDYATFTINYYKPEDGEKERVSSIKGYTFNLVDGEIKKTKLSKKSIFDERLNKYRGETKITMPNIKEGSVIEIKYQITSPFSSSIDDLQFQYNIPVKKLLYKVEIPEYLVFNQRMKGYYLLQAKKEFKSGRIGNDLNYRINISKYEGENIPALRDDEPYVSSIHNYRGGVKFELTSTKYPNSMLKYYTTSWEDVVKTIYKSSSFGNELEKTNYFKKDLSVILAPIKTDQEKMIAVYEFVKSKVKWNDFNGKYTDSGVRKAYKEGVGNVADINLMLTAMLREAGLNAKPILISTRNHGTSFFPTREGFNYIISGVKINDKLIYLDATEKYSAPDVLPLRAVNWNGRIINNKENSEWVDLIPTNYASEDNYAAILFDEDMEVSGMMRSKYTNLYALNYRSKNNHLKKEVVVEALENKYNIEIDDFKITNKKNTIKPLVRMFKFNSEDLVEEINGKLYLSPLLFLTQTVNPFKLDERKFPVDYGVPFKDKNTISIKIPEGYQVESLPENIAIGISDRIGVFRYKVVVTPGKIMIVSQLQINKAIITPEYYQELKEFYNQMIKKQKEKITLIKK